MWQTQHSAQLSDRFQRREEPPCLRKIKKLWPLCGNGEEVSRVSLVSSEPCTSLGLQEPALLQSEGEGSF